MWDKKSFHGCFIQEAQQNLKVSSMDDHWNYNWWLPLVLIKGDVLKSHLFASELHFFNAKSSFKALIRNSALSFCIYNLKCTVSNPGTTSVHQHSLAARADLCRHLGNWEILLATIRYTVNELLHSDVCVWTRRRLCASTAKNTGLPSFWKTQRFPQTAAFTDYCFFFFYI